jgi:murein DD-endopeptidase MepM/ murein hydrolase activator NlpD
VDFWHRAVSAVRSHCGGRLALLVGYRPAPGKRATQAAERATARQAGKPARKDLQHPGAITQLSDPKRHLALGPFDARGSASGTIEGAEGVDPLVRAIGENPQMAIGLLGQRLDELVSEAEKREGSIRQLETFLRGQKARLASTPSIWPSRGWVTSGFGTRVDPYTGKRTMHRGVDIANQPGVPVIAPARGVVTFRGTSGGFGKVIVLDHGYGIRSRYGHLEEYKVQLGDHLDRGDIVGTIGNTGRSTGPHLHYEVEVNGIAENPKNYILED